MVIATIFSLKFHYTVPSKKGWGQSAAQALDSAEIFNKAQIAKQTRLLYRGMSVNACVSQNLPVQIIKLYISDYSTLEDLLKNELCLLKRLPSVFVDVGKKLLYHQRPLLFGSSKLFYYLHSRGVISYNRYNRRVLWPRAITNLLLYSINLDCSLLYQRQLMSLIKWTAIEESVCCNKLVQTGNPAEMDSVNSCFTGCEVLAEYHEVSWSCLDTEGSKWGQERGVVLNQKYQFNLTREKETAGIYRERGTHLQVLKPFF